MNITEVQEQLVNMLPIILVITMAIGFIASFFGSKKKKEIKEVEPKLDSIDTQIQEIYNLQKRHKRR